MSNHNVIEADSYRQEERNLKSDPIVIQMAIEIKGDVQPVECDTHNFMGAANNEYRIRGGKANRTLGGVARAIKSLLTEWQASEKDSTGEAHA